MKIMLIAILLTLSLSSIATTVTPDVEVMSRILVRNPDVSAKLNTANITSLKSIETKSVKMGVTTYTLTYHRICECVPAKAVVTILEDLTPTYADRLPVYKSSVEILEGR